ncbi:phosphopantetheine-binding protein [Paenibacillus sp. KN14-4R]|uniref:phosphopantetheine-binding protein n=1 Tax=Paenibacillus sp. KN14-4R TaxID=3445773 RepID=UPI003F9F0E5B
MKRDNIIEKIKEILINNLEIEVQEDFGMCIGQTIDIDSIMVLQLVVYIEEEFNVTVPEEEINIDKFRELDALIEFIQGLLANKEG